MAKKTPLSELKGVGKKTEEILLKAKIDSVEKLAGFTIEKLEKKVPDLSKKTLTNILNKAQDYVLLTGEEEILEDEAKSTKKKPKELVEEIEVIKAEIEKKIVKEKPKRTPIGVVYSFKKGGNRIYTNVALANLTAPNIVPESLIGKKVWIRYPNGITRKGIVAGPHGNASCVRVKFNKGLSAKAIGSELLI
ncbi:MAG: helix-hairpin-helix domain-containing protein [Candidatus Odinarchaeia archaeon]